MKKLYFCLLLVVVSVFLAMAGDKVKVLRIYNGGVGTTIPLANIDSINHSKYDADSVLNANYITSVTWAIDSTYQIPINSIDSAVIAEIDMDEINASIISIQGFIAAQEEQEISLFQTSFLKWLKDQDWVYNATLSESGEIINISFINGINFYVHFQDSSFFEEPQESRTKSNGNTELFNYFNVSQIDDEKIIQQKDILLIQGRPMNFTGVFSSDNTPVPEREVVEYSTISKIIEEMPVDCYLELIRNSFAFLNTRFSDYGIIIISQTHGASDFPGAFQVLGLPSDETTINDGLTIYIRNKQILRMKDTPLYWWVKPKVLANLHPLENTIVYANYCSSFGLNNYMNSILIGYGGMSHYVSNKWGLDSFVEAMLSGCVYSEAYEKDRRMIHILRDPLTNKPDSKQRYFSISTNEIIEDDKGNPTISGKINGFDNLKKDDLTYILYVHESDEVEDTFTPEEAKDGEGWILGTNKLSYLESFTIDEKGNFSLKYPGAIIPGKNYGFIFAFEYKDKYYYGELKNYNAEKKEDVVIDEDVVDLGLGVKWASRNLGASAPNELGNKYDIDDFKVKAFYEHPEIFYDGGTKAEFCKTDYDYAHKTLGGGYRMPSYVELKDLKEKCKWELATIGEVAGFKVTGPNGKYIFLPTESTYEEFDNFGNMYTLGRTVYSSGTYDNNLGWSLASISISGVLLPMFESSSTLTITFDNDKEAYIRPVCE